MKALLVENLPGGREWVYEFKFDGVRALAIKDGNSVLLLSRAEKPLESKYPEVVAALKGLPARQAVLDGEIVALDSRGCPSFQLLQTYQRAGTRKPPLFYYVFDLVYLDGKDTTLLPLWRRKELAEKLIGGVSPRLRFSSTLRAEGARVRRELQARGLEGLVAKRKDSPYEPGRRSGAWAKFKWSNEQEFVIGGYTRPKGARSCFGALLVGYYEQDRLLFAAKVGTGFDERRLRQLHEKFQPLIIPRCPFTNLPEDRRAMSKTLTLGQMRLCTWLKPKLVCQIRFAEWTRDLHLRQPAFLGLREDKAPREVVREKPR